VELLEWSVAHSHCVEDCIEGPVISGGLDCREPDNPVAGSLRPKLRDELVRSESGIPCE